MPSFLFTRVEKNFNLNAKTMVEKLNQEHYAAELYPNRYGQICPICVSLVRFSYVNTLKMHQNCEKKDILATTGKIERNCETRVHKIVKISPRN